jgi:L-fuculose-phosphate aldolase
MFETEKKELIEYGIRVFKSGLVQGTGGNLSVRVGENGDMYLITPSGIDYEHVVLDDIVLIDMKGNIVEGKRNPSIEHGMHRAVYEKRRDVNAIIHTHSLYSTALSITKQPLPQIESSVVLMRGQIEVAEYARHGSIELAKNVVEALGDRKAALMANHGLLAADESLAKALKTCISVEHCAHMYILARSVGQVYPISPEKCDELRDYIKTSYGQKK